MFNSITTDISNEISFNDLNKKYIILKKYSVRKNQNTKFQLLMSIDGIMCHESNPPNYRVILSPVRAF